MSPSPFASAQLARVMLLVLTKLLDRIVARLHRRAWMIECVRRQSGSRLPSMVVVHLQNYQAHLTFIAGQEDAALAHLKEHLSLCNGDVTLAPGVGKRGARTRRCSRAAAAV